VEVTIGPVVSFNDEEVKTYDMVEEVIEDKKSSTDIKNNNEENNHQSTDLK